MYRLFRLSAVMLPLFTLMLTSCGEEKNPDAPAPNDTAAKSSVSNTETAKIVMQNLPSPMETAELLKDAGALYDASLLNDPSNVSKYSTAPTQALNLGVYGTDLSFTCIFDQPAESALFLKSSIKLAKDLGISEAFNESVQERCQNNITNGDSIMDIVNEAFWTADEKLIENERPSHSALIVAGGWIEGLYLATKVAAQTKNEALRGRIADQKASLESLLRLLEQYKADKDVAPILADLHKLHELFKGIAAPTTAKVSTDKNTKVTTIGDAPAPDITDEQLAQISASIQETRNKVVKLN